MGDTDLSWTQRGDFLLIQLSGANCLPRVSSRRKTRRHKWLLVQRAAIKTIKLDSGIETGMGKAEEGLSEEAGFAG